MTPELYTMYYWMFDFDANDFIEYDEIQREEIDTMHVKTFGKTFPEMWVYSYVNPRFCMTHEDLVLYGNNMFNIHSLFPAIGKFDYNNYCSLVFDQEEDYDVDYNEYFNEEPIQESQQKGEEESIYHLPSGLLDDEIESHYYLPSGLLDDEEESHYYLPSFMFKNNDSQDYMDLYGYTTNNDFFTCVPVKSKSIYTTQQQQFPESYYSGCVSF
jgi:hypothetical protein